MAKNYVLLLFNYFDKLKQKAIINILLVFLEKKLSNIKKKDLFLIIFNIKSVFNKIIIKVFINYL